MDDFIEQLRLEFLTFDREQLVQDLIDQIHNVHIPGTKAMLSSPYAFTQIECEPGTYLALDLGGTNFRAALIDFADDNDGPPRITRKESWVVPDHMKQSDSQVFFDWIGLCIKQFLIGEDVAVIWNTGLVFSFPVRETGVNTGYIMTMGKGFKFTDDISRRCINDMLVEACAKNGVKIQLVSIVNDTAAILYGARYQNPDVKMSLILGTGCNSAICCDRKLFQQVDRSEEITTVIVNTEMSMFGNGILPQTKYDHMIDKASSLPGYQPFEQMTSGKYLEKLIWLIIGDAMPCWVRPQLEQSFHFLYLCSKDHDASTVDSGGLVNTLYSQLTGVSSETEIVIVQDIAQIVADRSAILIAIMLVALSSIVIADPQIPREETRIVCPCDGTLLEKHPTMKIRCEEILSDLGSDIRLSLCPGSTLLGAAVTAAHALRQPR